MPDPLEETQINLEVAQWIASRRASGQAQQVHDALPAMPRDSDTPEGASAG
ncbi:MAG: hypothetical protein RL026_972 [Pseudomonadota bacterium]